MRSRKHYR